MNEDKTVAVDGDTYTIEHHGQYSTVSRVGGEPFRSSFEDANEASDFFNDCVKAARQRLRERAGRP